MTPEEFDDNFIEWFDSLFGGEEESEPTYRLVLPDKVIFGLDYEVACYRAGEEIRKAGGDCWASTYVGTSVEFYMVDEDEKEIHFASVESEVQL